jgi:hypothetical protein
MMNFGRRDCLDGVMGGACGFEMRFAAGEAAIWNEAACSATTVGV